MIGLVSLSLQTLATAEPAPRWNDSALRHAGMRSFVCEAKRVKAGDTYLDPIMTIPYYVEEERWRLVVGQQGQFWSGVLGGTGQPELSFDLGKYLSAATGDTPKKLGLTTLGALFDRTYPERPYLYVRFSVRSPQPLNKLVRFDVRRGNPLILDGMVDLLTWDSNGHNGGDLLWGPEDGFLYLTAGDGSAPGDPQNIGQQTEKIRGSVLRIDVHNPPDGKRYGIPPDNPFVGMPGVRPELWCYGLRNPWRMTFHPENGELWLGDNGDEHWELVHRIRRGANYGWSAYEGAHVFRASNPLKGPSKEYTLPVVEHPHTEMRSIIGGIFYRGHALAQLRGHYVYGCYFTKQLWAFSYEDGEAGKPRLIGELPGQLVDLSEDQDGEILASCRGGVYQLVPVLKAPPDRPWPPLLSETGLFVNTGSQEPASGVVPYRTNVQGWFDGATSERFVGVPPGPAMKQSGGLRLAKSWDFSPGTAIAQTLSVKGKRVETQVLYFDGQWRGYSYRWNEKGSDASLVDEGGETVELTLPQGGTQRWRFPSRAECMACHTQRTNFAISFTTEQLDCAETSGAGQLDRLLKMGYLQNSPQLRSLRGKPRADPHDESVPLELRARSYLDLNCAHCHRETGLGGRAGFQLMAHLPLAQTGIINAKAVVGLALGQNSRLVVPGAPEKSELLARMSRRGPGQMPLIGSHLVDERGVALIRKWIQLMK